MKILKLVKKENAQERSRKFDSVYREGSCREIIFLKGQRYAVLSSCEKSHGKGYTTHADLAGARIKRAALIARNIPNVVIDNEGTMFCEKDGILAIMPRKQLKLENSQKLTSFWG